MKKLLSIILGLNMALAPALVVAQSVLPQANLKISATVVAVEKEVTLDASDSLNSQGTRGSLEYRFKPTISALWTEWSGNPVLKFRPLKTGNQQARLEIRDTRIAYRQQTFLTYKVRESVARTARIKVLNQGAIHVGDEVFFQIDVTGPRNTDFKNIQVRWDFDGRGIWDTPFLRDQTASFVFSRAAQTSPRAEVKFPDGETILVRGIEPEARLTNSRDRIDRRDFTKLKIGAQRIFPPILEVSPGYKVFTEKTAFTFDASKTRKTSNSWIEFHFDGDEVVRFQDKVIKKFANPGNHTVLVKHCYKLSSPVCEEATIKVEVEADPTDFRADFSISDLTNPNNYFPSNGDRPFVITRGDRLAFNGYLLETDPQSRNTQYRWDFDGDGLFDTSFSNASRAEYTFTQTGTFTPQLQVKNEFTRADEQLVIANHTIQVRQNEKPTGYFVIQKSTVNPSQDRTKIFAGERVRFLPKLQDSKSDNNNLEVRFDVDGDGRWESDFRRYGSFEWRFQTPGTYVSTMQIKDPSGAVQTVKQRVLIDHFHKPEIKVKVSQKTAAIGETFTFDASPTAGNRLIYTWDIPENHNLEGASFQQVTAQFKTPGQKVVTLAVADPDGQSDWYQFPVWVTEAKTQTTIGADTQAPQSNSPFNIQGAGSSGSFGSSSLPSDAAFLMGRFQLK